MNLPNSVSKAAGSRWWPAAAIAGAVLAVDQITKSLVMAHDSASADRTPTGVLSVHLIRNAGASLGIGSGHELVVVAVAVVVTIGVGVAVARCRSRVAALCWAIVLGGSLGNLADRFFRSPGSGHGAVVDWIHIVGDSASFNVADVAIRFGAIAALIAMFVASRSHRAGVGVSGSGAGAGSGAEW